MMYEEGLFVFTLSFYTKHSCLWTGRAKESTCATVLNTGGNVLAHRRMKNEYTPGFLEPLGVDRVAMEASTYIIPV